jgi:hypothetical protein
VKSLFSIALTLLLMLNILGYYGIFLGLQYKNDHDFSLRLEQNQYSQNDVMTITVPMAIPYHSDDQEFSRAEGRIQYDGNIYRLTKQKLVHDTLYIVCIRDKAETKIAEALSDYVKTFTDNPSHTNHGKATVNLIKDYLPTDISISSQVQGWSKEITFADHALFFQSHCADISTPPPQQS